MSPIVNVRLVLLVLFVVVAVLTLVALLSGRRGGLLTLLVTILALTALGLPFLSYGLSKARYHARVHSMSEWADAELDRELEARELSRKARWKFKQDRTAEAARLQMEAEVQKLEAIARKTAEEARVMHQEVIERVLNAAQDEPKALEELDPAAVVDVQAEIATDDFHHQVDDGLIDDPFAPEIEDRQPDHVAEAATAPPAPESPVVPPVPASDEKTSQVAAAEAHRAMASEGSTHDLAKSDAPDEVTSGTEAAPQMVVEQSKPDWIYDHLVLDHEPHRITVRCGPFLGSPAEMKRMKDDALINSTLEYAESYLQAHGRAPRVLGQRLTPRIPIQRIRECVAATYEDIHQSETPGVAPMPIEYVLLEFDEDFRRRVLDHYWQESRSLVRSIKAGFMALGVLVLLGTVWLGLQVDSSVKGKYRTTALVLASLGGIVAVVTLLSAGMLIR